MAEDDPNKWLLGKGGGGDSLNSLVAETEFQMPDFITPDLLKLGPAPSHKGDAQKTPPLISGVETEVWNWGNARLSLKP